jgi:hypothetical protein
MSKTMTFLRKYQKLVFSVLCVVLVVTWGLSYSADQLMNLGRGGAGANPAQDVILTWVGGKLTRHELELRRRAHFNAVRYLFAVMQRAQEAQGKPSVPMLDQGSPIPPSNDAQTVIDIMLRAEKARRVGVRVNDDAVKQFLMRLSGDVLREGDLGAIARETLGQEMSDQALMEQLQEELLSQQMRLLAVSSLTTLSLGDDWEYFCRLNRRMHIEAYGIDVDKFTEEVKGKPSVKELRTLFDKYKDNDPDPNSAEPGFRNLQRVAWEYLKIDFTPYLETAKKEITDEQIQKYYDEAIAKGEFKVKPEEEKEGDKKDSNKPDTTKKDADEKTSEEKEGDKEKSSTEKPADESKAENKDAEKKGSDDKDTDKKAAEKPEEQSAGNPQSEDAAQPASDEVTAGDPSKQAQDAKAADAAKPADAKPAEPKAKEKPVAEQAKTEKPGDEKPAQDKPADKEAADKEGAEKAADKKADEPKFKPLEEVRGDIVTILARPIAQDAMNKDVQQLIEALKKYNLKVRKYDDAQRIQKSLQADGKNSRKAKEVEPPGDFEAAAIAKQLGAEHVTTPLVNRYEVADEELGREGMIFFREAFQFVPFADAAYSRDVMLYEPMDVFFRGGTETKVIVWATKKEAPQPLKFDDKDVQERLLAAWKKQKAVELARKAAAAIAAEAKDKNSLQEALPKEAMVIKPAPFSWLTGGAFTPAMGARVSLSQVEGIELAGPEFMEAVSRLKLGETGVAINHSHSQVYVVRLLQQEPSEEDLRERFLESGSSMAVRSAAGQDVSRMAQQLEQQLADELKVVYKTPLQAPLMEEP